MTLNPYFTEKYTYTPTQDLAADLIDEIIQINGMDIQYIPRVFANLDYLFGEDRDSTFENVYTIEIYPDKFEGFGGEGDFISKFGLEIRDTMNFSMSKRRFEQVIGTPENMDRPKEGDLIYFPISKHLFQINFVEHEVPFYQLGKLYLYQLTCSLMEYSQEAFTTGDTNIDETAIAYKNNDDVSLDPFANNEEIQTEDDDSKSTTEDNVFGNY